jgi:hypothetical protein
MLYDDPALVAIAAITGDALPERLWRYDTATADPVADLAQALHSAAIELTGSTQVLARALAKLGVVAPPPARLPRPAHPLPAGPPLRPDRWGAHPGHRRRRRHVAGVPGCGGRRRPRHKAGRPQYPQLHLQGGSRVGVTAAGRGWAQRAVPGPAPQPLPCDGRLSSYPV